MKDWIELDHNLTDICEKIAQQGGGTTSYVIEKLFFMLQTFQKRDCIQTFSDNFLSEFMKLANKESDERFDAQQTKF